MGWKFNCRSLFSPGGRKVQVHKRRFAGGSWGKKSHQEPRGFWFSRCRRLWVAAAAVARGLLLARRVTAEDGASAWNLVWSCCCSWWEMPLGLVRCVSCFVGAAANFCSLFRISCTCKSVSVGWTTQLDKAQDFFVAKNMYFCRRKSGELLDRIKASYEGYKFNTCW